MCASCIWLQHPSLSVDIGQLMNVRTAASASGDREYPYFRNFSNCCLTAFGCRDMPLKDVSCLPLTWPLKNVQSSKGFSSEVGNSGQFWQRKGNYGPTRNGFSVHQQYDRMQKQVSDCRGYPVPLANTEGYQCPHVFTPAPNIWCQAVVHRELANLEVQTANAG